MKTLLISLFLFLTLGGYGQLKVTQAIIYYKDAQFTVSPLIPVAASNTAAVPLRQMQDTITARIAGFHSGTVTSVGTGLGLTGGTLTTTGTLALDTANASVLSRQRAANTYIAKGSGGLGTVTSVGTGLGLSGGTISTTGTLALDTANAAVLSRQRAANTYQAKLGFTPYNSSNPNGYTNNTGTVTSVGTGLGLSGGTISTTGTLALDTANAAVLSRQRAANTYTAKTSMSSYQLKADTVALSNYISGANTQIAKFRGDSAVVGITNGVDGQVITMVSGAPAWATPTAGNPGTVTSVATGLGLTGGTFTTTGTLALDTANASVLSRQRAANTYTAKTSMSSYQLKADTVALSNYISGANTQIAKFRGDSAVVGITNGVDGQVITMVSGAPAWATPTAGNSGTVTSVATGLGLTGGTFTTTGTVALDTTNVTVLSRQRAANTYQAKLGFTPYNSSNPNGYTNNTGTVTSVGTGLGLSGGTISTTGTVALDTTNVTVLSRQRAANTYTAKTSMSSYQLKADTMALSNYISGATNQIAKFRGDSAVVGITNGTNGQVMTMVSSAPAWSTPVQMIGYAKYSFGTDGGAISTITPSISSNIPDNSIIVGGVINVTTAVTSSGSATVAVGTSGGSSTTSLMAATAKSTLTIDKLMPVVPTYAVPIKLTASGNITVTIAAATLTAGVIEIWIVYFTAAN